MRIGISCLIFGGLLFTLLIRRQLASCLLLLLQLFGCCTIRPLSAAPRSRQLNFEINTLFLNLLLLKLSAI